MSGLAKRMDQSGCLSCPGSMLDSSSLFESELAEQDTDATGLKRTAGKEEFVCAFRLSGAYRKRFLMSLEYKICQA